MPASAPRVRTSPRLLAATALIAAWGVFFAVQLFDADSVPFYRDNLLTYLPLRQFMHERLRSGHFPQWYPYEALGVPLVGQIAVGLFHPATYLLLPFSAFTAVKLNLLAAYLVALVGAYRLARYLGIGWVAAVTAAYAFGFGGYLLGVSSTLPYVMSEATLPWAAWAAFRLADRRRAKDIALLALTTALLFLAGDPQTLLLSVVVCAIAIGQRWTRATIGVFATSGVLTVLLCAIDLLPGQVSFAQSVRVAGQLTADIDRFWSLRPLRLPELLIAEFVPDGFRDEVMTGLLGSESSPFVTTIFAGAITLSLAAIGVRSRRRGAIAFTVLGIVALWLSLGAGGGLLTVVRTVLPPLRRFRYPEKYLSVFWLALVPLVGFGAQRVLEEPRRWIRPLAATAAALSLIALANGIFEPARWIWTARGHSEFDHQAMFQTLRRVWTGHLLVSALFVALVAGTLWLVVRRPALAAALPLLAFVELFVGNGSQLPMVSRSLIEQQNDFATLVAQSARDGAPPSRVFSQTRVPRDTVTGPEHEQWVASTLGALEPDASGLYGVPSLGVRLGAFSLRYAHLVGISGENAGRWGPLLNACFHVFDAAHRANEPVIAFQPQLGFALARWDCRPRAFLSGASRVSREAEAMKWMSSASAATTVVPWEGGPNLAPPGAAMVHWRVNEPESEVLEIDSNAPAALVISDEMMPGWSATIDGQPAVLHPTLIALRGIEVPAGHHRVELTYRAPRLVLGVSLSALGALLCGLLVFGPWRRRIVG